MLSEMERAYKAGYLARLGGHALKDCFAYRGSLKQEWRKGWLECDKACYAVHLEKGRKPQKGRSPRADIHSRAR